jgi:glycosyltransferase involved in cell wall biosynthesis
MTRVLHLVRPDADLQTRYTIETLRETLAGEFDFAARVVRSPLDVVRLRREGRRFDLAHVWDKSLLKTAALAGFARVVFQAAAATLPPVDIGASNHTSRQRARNELVISDEHFVLLAPGESTRVAAHERAAWVGSILHVTDERYRVLLWGRGPRLDVAAELGDKLRQPGLVVVAGRVLKRSVEFEELLPAADALLVTPVGPAPLLPVAMAMSAGVPVIACDRAEFSELLIDRETSWNVPTCAVRPLAQCVLDLRADPTTAVALVRRARERVREVCSRDRFVNAYRRLYGVQLITTS